MRLTSRTPGVPGVLDLLPTSDGRSAASAVRRREPHLRLPGQVLDEKRGYYEMRILLPPLAEPAVERATRRRVDRVLSAQVSAVGVAIA
jgi:hypothetical protein